MNHLHAIQLREVTVSRLLVDVVDQPASSNYTGEVDLEFKIGTSDLTKEDPFIAVGFQVKATPQSKTPGGQPPFTIEVSLSGQFEVDFKNFDFNDLPDWSKRNAPFLLLPYVREQLYGLALRAGIKSFTLPLFVQPIRPPKA